MELVLLYKTDDGTEIAYETAEFNSGHASNHESTLSEFAKQQFKSLKQHRVTRKAYPRINEVTSVTVFSRVFTVPVTEKT